MAQFHSESLPPATLSKLTSRRTNGGGTHPAPHVVLIFTLHYSLLRARKKQPGTLSRDFAPVVHGHRFVDLRARAKQTGTLSRNFAPLRPFSLVLEATW